jgi:hypothetical protein
MSLFQERADQPERLSGTLGPHYRVAWPDNPGKV